MSLSTRGLTHAVRVQAILCRAMTRFQSVCSSRFFWCVRVFRVHMWAYFSKWARRWLKHVAHNAHARLNMGRDYCGRTHGVEVVSAVWTYMCLYHQWSSICIRESSIDIVDTVRCAVDEKKRHGSFFCQILKYIFIFQQSLFMNWTGNKTKHTYIYQSVRDPHTMHKDRILKSKQTRRSSAPKMHFVPICTNNMCVWFRACFLCA